MLFRCLKIKMPVMSVEMIANSRFATDQSSTIPNPQKVMLTFNEVVTARMKSTQEIRATTIEAIIEERETYFDFLRVIPNVRKPISNEAQLVRRAKPA